MPLGTCEAEQAASVKNAEIQRVTRLRAVLFRGAIASGILSFFVTCRMVVAAPVHSEFQGSAMFFGSSPDTFRHRRMKLRATDRRQPRKQPQQHGVGQTPECRRDIHQLISGDPMNHELC